jgi:hypothetical protein
MHAVLTTVNPAVTACLGYNQHQQQSFTVDTMVLLDKPCILE